MTVDTAIEGKANEGITVRIDHVGGFECSTVFDTGAKSAIGGRCEPDAGTEELSLRRG